jgi:hypothetical protein
MSTILSIAALVLSLSIAGTPAFAATYEGDINARLLTNGLYDVAVMASTETASSVLIGRHFADPNTGKITGAVWISTQLEARLAWAHIPAKSVTPTQRESRRLSCV